MNRHLSPEEFITALEDAPESLAPHLASCVECRDVLARLRSAADEASLASVPEPSPLFWDHFSERVKAATSDGPLSVTPRFWQPIWRPLGAVAGVVGAVALLILMRAPDRPALSVPVPPDVSATSLSAGADDGSWEIVVGLAADLAEAEVRGAVAPAIGTTDGLLDELTADERHALVRLMQAEMGGVQ